MRSLVISILLTVFLAGGVFSQIKEKRDKAYFKEYKKGEHYYYSTILKDIREYKEKQTEKKPYMRLKVDLSGMKFPDKVSMYESQWHFKPISQGNTGTCWCFSTTSFFESEVYRLTGQKIKLSEMYTVYWEYVEKARRFVQERGNSKFDQGSEADAVQRMYKIYGIVPKKVYDGLLEGQKFYTHEDMFNEMKSYLNSIKECNCWNEEEVLATIKSILNHYMGKPPEKFIWQSKEYSPITFLNEVLKLNMDDYVCILSYKQKPYWQKVEYEVPDNWWHSEEYYNVPLDDYMKALKDAINKGYTMSIGGDVTEPGFLTDKGEPQVAIIPTFDIPQEYINEDARQFRFSNKTTTDDHGMHLVGKTEYNGYMWFLIKDSSSGSRNNDPQAPEFGYYFFREDYIKLKIMDFMVHKDAVKDLLKKFK